MRAMQIDDEHIDLIPRRYSKMKTRAPYMDMISNMLLNDIAGLEIEFDSEYETSAAQSNLYYHKKQYGLPVRAIKRKNKLYVINERREQSDCKKEC